MARVIFPPSRPQMQHNPQEYQNDADDPPAPKEPREILTRPLGEFPIRPRHQLQIIESMRRSITLLDLDTVLIRRGRDRGFELCIKTRRSRRTARRRDQAEHDQAEK